MQLLRYLNAAGTFNVPFLQLHCAVLPSARHVCCKSSPRPAAGIRLYSRRSSATLNQSAVSSARGWTSCQNISQSEMWKALSTLQLNTLNGKLSMYHKSLKTSSSLLCNTVTVSHNSSAVSFKSSLSGNGISPSSPLVFHHWTGHRGHPPSPSREKSVARPGSSSRMVRSKMPTVGDVFSLENRARVMTHLSSKKTLRRFYTRDVRRRGAVLVPLCSVGREPCVLFTLRTRTLKDHSGEVSFPGGKMDPTDGDVCHTALREMEEELGINPSMVEVWGHLPPVGQEPVSVVPVIGYLGEINVSRLEFNRDEVSEVFVMTLSHLCCRGSQAYTTFEPHVSTGTPTATLPVFVGGEHRVWGLTAYILDQVLQAIVPDHYRSLVTQVKKEQLGS